MKKCELLSPAGNMEMLKYAIMYGADAIYLAGTKYGARKFAQNFSDKELEEAINYAHLYGVNIYITINTLIYEEEVDDFLDYVKYITRIGVDAVLVQDFGMLNAIRKVSPDLEIHASTQMHNSGKDFIEILKNLGVKRVVLDREISLKEIKNIENDVGIEVFCHGALCVSYSGQCLFSSRIINRSGNRGECAGLCRLPYRLKSGDNIDKKSKYYLSLKDLCTASYIEEILKSGIDCLKIEGRMKSPSYVGYITSVYRRLIDSYYDRDFKSITEEELKNMALLFNRGFTKGYLNCEENNDIGNISSPNHIGIHLGTYKVMKNKVEITLDEELCQGDVIRFKSDNKGMTVNFLYDKNENLIKEANANKKVYVDNFLGLNRFGEVRKVSSKRLMDRIDKLPERRVLIKMTYNIVIGKQMCLIIDDGKNRVKVFGKIPSKAINRPINREDVLRQLSKIGNTIYKIENITGVLDECLYVDLKSLNELRRKALEELDQERTKVAPRKIYDLKKEVIVSCKTVPVLSIVIETEEQYQVARKYSKRVYSRNELILRKYKNEVFPVLADCNNLLHKDKCMICDYGLLNDKNLFSITTHYIMNVVNSHTVNALLSYNNVSYVTLSVEMSLKQIQDLKDKVDFSKLSILIYGNLELMKMKFDPTLGKGEALVSDKGDCYKVKKSGSYNYLMDSNAFNRLDELEEFKKLGIGDYQIHFEDEDATDCEKILKIVSSQLG